MVPAELTVVFDVRLTNTVDHTKFEAMIKEWCKEAGEGVNYTFEQKWKIESTKLDDTNPFWIAMKQTCDEIDIKLKILIFPGGTDSRFVRSVSSYVSIAITNMT